MLEYSSPRVGTDVEADFMIPFARDDQFVGRKDIITDIDLKLKATRRAAVAGIGGAG
jgi:hypothetical protein